MSGNGIFSMGLAGPLILLVLGQVAIGLLFSGAAIVATLRADSELRAGKSLTKTKVSIVILVVSALLPILAGALSRYGAYYGAATILALIGPLLLWPLSAVLAIWGRGAGRRVLLVGHGLIAAWVSLLLLIILIHVF